MEDSQSCLTIDWQRAPMENNKENAPVVHTSILASHQNKWINNPTCMEENVGNTSSCTCCTTSSGIKSFLPLQMLKDFNDEIKFPSKARNDSQSKNSLGKHRSSEVIVIDSDSDDDDIYPTSTKILAAQTSSKNESYALDDSSSEAEWDGDLEYVHSVADNRDTDSSTSVEELIQRTKEIVILTDDDEDVTVSPPKPPRRPTSKNRSRSAQTLQRKPESARAFRRRRDELSQQLLVAFDRTVFGSKLLIPVRGSDELAVSLTWSNKLRTTAGLTRLKALGNPFVKNIGLPNVSDSRIRTAMIELSTKVVDGEVRLRSTLLHELCHAAAWIIDGIMKPAHGPCFKRWAKLAMKAVPDVTVTTRHNYEIRFKHTWVCVNYPDRCNTMIQRHSRSVNPDRHVCGQCKGRLQEVSLDEL